ncbi:MAG: VOC family protein [Cyclobacteriaceae bacterium]|nr:VOC family protein [Cyclobacteriaceae bacterium]
MTNPIYPCLWFDGNAKAAAEFYCSAFPNSKITADTPMVVNFELDGKKFMGLNGGPQFKFNPSISFFAICETESEVDSVWNKLLKDAFVMMPLNNYPWSKKYGWLRDTFGISWQVMMGDAEQMGGKIIPAFMFTGSQAGKAESAMNFYAAIFRDSKIKDINRYLAGEHDVEGTVKHARFHLGKENFVAMDSSAPHAFEFNEAISFVLECGKQEEIDYYWGKLTEGGQESQCGWLKDKFGVSWQIVPTILGKLMSDPTKSQRVMAAFMQMKKFDIEKLLNA